MHIQMMVSMPMRLDLIFIILPLFGIMLAGYLAGRFQVLTEGSSLILNQFVFVVSLPALIFISLSRVPVGDFFNWPFLGVLGGGMMVTFCLSLLVARLAFPGSLTAHGLHGPALAAPQRDQTVRGRTEPPGAAQ